MTDPSPDCGYTDAEEALEAKERMFNDSALERLVASGRQYQDEHGRYIAPLAQLLLKARSRVTEQTRRTDQAFEEIARLREFGEHYSGAAQDAWDRIEVLEKALRDARKGLDEAYWYGYTWPIGLDTDPQEQRGMARDTFIRNMEHSGEVLSAALEETK